MSFPSPRVSVLMPVYNGMPYIREAVESIQKQTCSDWELIVINDCSTDDTSSFLASINDERIHVLTNSSNVGPGVSIARGFQVSHCPYVARLDADDIALPERLEKQIAFLDRNKSYGLVGGGCIRIKESGEDLDIIKPTCGSAELRWKLFFMNPFISSSVMFRAAVVAANCIEFPTTVGTEDFGLWSKISTYTNIENLPIPLVKYRIRESSLSQTNKLQMLEDDINISWSTIQNAFPSLNIERSLVQDVCKWRKKFFLKTSSDLKLALVYIHMLKLYSSKYSNANGMHNFVIRERNKFWRKICQQKSILALLFLTPHFVRL